MEKLLRNLQWAVANPKRLLWKAKISNFSWNPRYKLQKFFNKQSIPTFINISNGWSNNKHVKIKNNQKPNNYFIKSNSQIKIIHTSFWKSKYCLIFKVFSNLLKFNRRTNQTDVWNQISLCSSLLNITTKRY